MTGSSILSSASSDSLQSDENLRAQFQAFLVNEFGSEKDGVQKDLEALRVREHCFDTVGGENCM